MKIASAQIEVKVGDIDNNLKKHLQTIEVASKHNVDLIVFPEMSLSGYCREEALNLSFKEHDARLLSLKETSLFGLTQVQGKSNIITIQYIIL